MATPPPSVQDAENPLERDPFLRSLIRELAGALQDVIGVEEASGFVSLVGQRIGRQIDQYYKAAESSAEALRALEEWEPRLMISDIEMPGEDGY